MTSYRLKYTAIAIPLHASQCSSRLQDFIIESVDTTPSLALPVTPLQLQLWFIHCILGAEINGNFQLEFDILKELVSHPSARPRLPPLAPLPLPTPSKAITKTHSAPHPPPVLHNPINSALPATPPTSNNRSRYVLQVLRVHFPGGARMRNID